MRSPGPAQLALDGSGTMVNCTVKSEGKKEPCHEAPQGLAAAAEPQPGDPARATQDGADPQAPAQVTQHFSVSHQCPHHTTFALSIRPFRAGTHPTSWVEGQAEIFISGTRVR